MAATQKNVDVEGAKKRIRAAFELFDKEGKGCVIQEEVSTIMRYLGAFPSEKDMVEKILPEIQEDEPTAFVTYGKFEELMLQVLTTHDYDFLLPDTEHVLLAAFKTLDADNKGYLEADRMRELLTTRGTYFRGKEIEGFMSVAKDIDTGHIFYEDYIAMLTQEAEQAQE